MKKGANEQNRVFLKHIIKVKGVNKIFLSLFDVMIS